MGLAIDGFKLNVNVFSMILWALDATFHYSKFSIADLKVV